MLKHAGAPWAEKNLQGGKGLSAFANLKTIVLLRVKQKHIWSNDWGKLKEITTYRITWHSKTIACGGIGPDECSLSAGAQPGIGQAWYQVPDTGSLHLVPSNWYLEPDT
jgi:hypothetical protein